MIDTLCTISTPGSAMPSSGVPHLVIGHDLALDRAEQPVLLLQPGDDALDALREVVHFDGRGTPCQPTSGTGPFSTLRTGPPVRFFAAPGSVLGRLVQVVHRRTRAPATRRHESGGAARGRYLCTHLGKPCSRRCPALSVTAGAFSSPERRFSRSR